MRWLVILGAFVSLSACARSFELLSTGDGGADFGPSDPSSDSGTDAHTAADAGPDATNTGLDSGEIPSDAMVMPRACTVPDYHMCTLVDVCEDGEPNAFLWNGVRCEAVCLSQCAGPGCADAFASRDECLSAHAACDPMICATTGGVWDSEQSCDVYRCGGRFVPEECTAIIGTPGCICPIGETFEPGRGCAPDATCTASEICQASGGTFRGMGTGGRGLRADYYLCGENLSAPSIGGPLPTEDLTPEEVALIESTYVPGCDCGRGGLVLAPWLQCSSSTLCREASVPGEDSSEFARNLCEDSGGAWNPAANGHTLCGEAQALGTTGGCLCGARQRFDAERGCVLDTSCLNRHFGQYCETAHSDYCVDPDAVCQPAVPDELGGYCSVADLVSACTSIISNPHHPQCRNTGTSDEGWYWADTNERLCLTSCVGHTAYCDTDEESDWEGWFTNIAAACPGDPPHNLLAEADCE